VSRACNHRSSSLLEPRPCQWPEDIFERGRAKE
jgi:hypothetical protein